MWSLICLAGKDKPSLSSNKHGTVRNPTNTHIRREREGMHDMKKALLFAMMMTATPAAWAGDNADLDRGLAAYEARDYARALEYLRPLAKKGDASAQHFLGVMYEHGYGVEQDDAKAARWIHKAARQGFAKAQFNMGRMYYGAKGAKQDAAEALKWFRKAAARGDIDAQLMIYRLIKVKRD